MFSTFILQPDLWLDDPHHDPAQRGKGIGRAMMRQLSTIASKQGCARIDWAVVSQNREGPRFYARLGPESCSVGK